MLMAIAAILLTLILVVGVHEGGHALAARIFGVKIKKISIGFGKPLLRWQTQSGCEWIWAFFPIGGYVQFENTRISPVNPEEFSGCFDKKPIGQRIIVLLSGALANFIFAWLAFILIYSIGLDYRLPEIQTVESQSIAARAGILPGDRFLSIGGYTTSTWSDVGMRLVILWGKKDIPVILTLANGEEEKAKLDLSNVAFQERKSSLLAQLGIQPDLSAAKSTLHASSFGDALRQANQSIGTMVYFFLMILKQLVIGNIPFSVLLGPLGIFAASITSFMQGAVAFIFFIASLSVAVGLINLFPVPGLDGGSIIYAIIEKIRGKPVSVAMEVLLHRLAFIVFFVLLIHLLMNDLQRII